MLGKEPWHLWDWIKAWNGLPVLPKGFLAVKTDAVSVMDKAKLVSFHVFAEKWQILKLLCMPGRLAFQLTMVQVNT